MDLLLGDGMFPSAREYLKHGISPKEYLIWYAVGGWDIEKMRELVAAGLDDYDKLICQTEEGFANYRATIAYKYCNGDLTIDDVKRLIS